MKFKPVFWGKGVFLGVFSETKRLFLPIKTVFLLSHDSSHDKPYFFFIFSHIRHLQSILFAKRRFFFVYLQVQK